MYTFMIIKLVCIYIYNDMHIYIYIYIDFYVLLTVGGNCYSQPG